MIASESVTAEDVLPVRSRIAWGPVLAGAVLALATYFLLTLVGTALGLSVHGRVSDQGLATGAVVWAVITTAWSLFVGGFIASQFTTGENKFEGMVYGLMVWGVVLATIITLLAIGVRAGFGAMVGVAQAAPAANTNWEEVARRNGATDADVERAKTNMANSPASVRDAINDPANRQAAEENATKAAWYSVLGTVLSMLAAGAGGYIGAGPTFRLLTVRTNPVVTRGKNVPLVRA